MPIIFFNFYGFPVAVKSDKEEVLTDIHRDFSYFRTEPVEARARLELFADYGRRDLLPRLKATLQTPRNLVYRNGEASYLDYFGRGLAIYQSQEGRYEIYCGDRDLAHEIAFLTILSLVGQHLDAIGLHRVHALGVETGGLAVLILLPMGGGKTTLALQLLCSEEIKLLSEDSPLISGNGEVFPFPLRLGVRVGGEPSGIPSQYLRTVKRMEFGPKTLIDIGNFKDKIASSCPAGAILLGERWLAGPSSIRPVGRRRAINEFIKNSVVGLGLYQGMEFLLQRSAWEILGRVGVAFSRLRNSLKVIERSQVYRFAIGPDAKESAEVLVKFLRGFSPPPAT
ncbi:MAG: hypothetical protein ABSA09_03085 [Desulfobaccales bacterium]|jgi:hypothetical protein